MNEVGWVIEEVEDGDDTISGKDDDREEEEVVKHLMMADIRMHST